MSRPVGGDRNETFDDWIRQFDEKHIRPIAEMLRTRMDWMGTSMGILMFGTLCMRLRDELIAVCGLPEELDADE